jgi:hypothetical protein
LSLPALHPWSQIISFCAVARHGANSICPSKLCGKFPPLRSVIFSNTCSRISVSVYAYSAKQIVPPTWKRIQISAFYSLPCKARLQIFSGCGRAETSLTTGTSRTGTWSLDESEPEPCIVLKARVWTLAFIFPEWEL